MANSLQHSLATLERDLRRAGALVASRFREGIDESTVRRALDPLGLSPSAELVTWFAWHDGAGDDDTSLDECILLPGAVFYDLRTLCQEYLEIRRNFDEVVADVPAGTLTSSDLWNPSWFPLLRLWAGYVAVDLGAADKTTSPVHIVWFDAELDYRKRALWPSLNDFIVEMVRRFENGIYTVDHNGVLQGPDVDAASST